MQGWEDLRAVRASADKLDEVRFSGRYPHCVLVSLEIGGGLLARNDPDRGPGTMRHLRKSNEAYAPSVVQYTNLAHRVTSASSAWITIGRTSDNDVVVNDYAVSRNHARFRNVPGVGYAIEDLASVNGTAVDGKWLEHNTSSPLRSGESLRFGRLAFTFLEPRDFQTFLVTLVPAV